MSMYLCIYAFIYFSFLFSKNVQTSSEDQPASHAMMQGFYPGCKAAGSWGWPCISI